MQLSQKTRKSRFINLTPLIDVIFLLVVFYMLTSQFTITEIINLTTTSITTSKNSADKQNKNNIFITIKQKDDYTINDKPYTSYALQNALIKMLEKNTNSDIYLQTKEATTVQDVVYTIDLINKSGGKNINLVE